jgi:polyphosphate kinase
VAKDTPFMERDISWLAFNGRVLQEAQDPTVPLYERIKFLAIYSSNLDEFFRVRVASLRSFRKLNKKTRQEMELRPKRLLKEIRQLVQEQQVEFGRVFRGELISGLKENNIHLIDNRSFTATQKEFALKYFKDHILPDLKWTEIKKGSIPFLENKVLYLITQFENKEELGCFKIPDNQRFVELPAESGQYFICFIDDVLRVGLRDHFVEEKIINAFSVKMSRDAEMYIDDEYEGDLLDKIKKGLEEREVGLPARFLYDASMPEEVLKNLKSLFQLTKNDLIPGARYHNFNDFFGFPDPTNNPALHYKPMPPLPHAAMEKLEKLLPAISEKDYLLHFPYQKFDYTFQLIEEAANDPEVAFLKVTLYRVATKSSVAECLLKALANGKKVNVFIEAKARFDEESNLFWGSKLSEAGANVRYSFPGIKVHTKLLLIGRREVGNLRHYAYIATGNFNEKTAKIYSDFALLTADPRLADEVSQVFEMLEGNVILPKAKNVLVAPHTLRIGLEKLINKEITNAKDGKEAWLILKLNSLEDEGMMEKLIDASQAGVKIKIICRGICRLVPGVKGLTENIEIISIVDRFLEHARVYIFCGDGKEKMYLASADWMTRNLSRRVEVAYPIFDEQHKKTIREIIDFQLNDNVKARYIDAENSNRYVRNSGEKVRAQMETYRYLNG